MLEAREGGGRNKIRQLVTGCKSMLLAGDFDWDDLGEGMGVLIILSKINLR